MTQNYLATAYSLFDDFFVVKTSANSRFFVRKGVAAICANFGSVRYAYACQLVLRVSFNVSSVYSTVAYLKVFVNYFLIMFFFTFLYYYFINGRGENNIYTSIRHPDEKVSPHTFTHASH